MSNDGHAYDTTWPFGRRIGIALVVLLASSCRAPVAKPTNEAAQPVDVELAKAFQRVPDQVSKLGNGYHVLVWNFHKSWSEDQPTDSLYCVVLDGQRKLHAKFFAMDAASTEGLLSGATARDLLEGGELTPRQLELLNALGEFQKLRGQ